MLNALALPQTTNIDKATSKNFVGSQALSVHNSTLLENLTIHGQSDTETIQAYLQTFIGISGSMSVFNEYQKTAIFQIPRNQNFAFQITKLNSSYMRLDEIMITI